MIRSLAGITSSPFPLFRHWLTLLLLLSPSFTLGVFVTCLELLETSMSAEDSKPSSEVKEFKTLLTSHLSAYCDPWYKWQCAKTSTSSIRCKGSSGPCSPNINWLIHWLHIGNRAGFIEKANGANSSGRYYGKENMGPKMVSLRPSHQTKANT